MKNTWQNAKKLNFGPNFGLFGPNLGPPKLFLLLVVRHCSKLSSYVFLWKLTNQKN